MNKTRRVDRLLLSNRFDLRMDGQGTKGSSSSSESILQNYRLGKILGIGSFGKVKLAQHVLTGHKVAIKILNRQTIDDSNAERVRREISMLRLLSHPHIVRLYEVVETRSKIYVVMEYMNCGELFYYVVEKGRLQEDEARYFFQQIISGVECCHSNMVVHRDLKPENLLLDSKHNVKIADLGLGNMMRDGHFLKTSCGSPNYAAPEVISGQLYAGPEVDVWSCGVILYAFLCGRLPFDDDNLSALYKKIKSGVYMLPSHLSPGARDLIPRILLVDSIKRITIPEILRHPWFRDQLPPYLAVPQIEAMKRVKKIDEEILQEVIKMGFNLYEVIESLRNRLQNEATVAYYLLLDNRFRASIGSLENEIQDTLPQEYTDYPGMYLRPQLPSERKWALGFQSQASPRETMTEVLKALQNLNVCWKKIGSYNMKCRWLPAFYTYSRTTLHLPLIFGMDKDGIRSPTAVKFEMQLYKAREGRYILDLQMIQGPPLLFLEVCAKFLAQLRII